MSISTKLEYLNGTKGKLKDSINKFRNGITNQTTFRNYATELDGIYDLLPKVEKTTSSDTLLNAQNGLVDDFKMYGNTKQGKLPDGYTQVDYIESSGEQYIDTGIKGNQDTKVNLDFEGTNFSYSGNKSIIGSRTNATEKHYGITISAGANPYLYSGYNNVSQQGVRISLNTKYNIFKDKNIMYLDNTQITNATYTTFETSTNMFIFAMNEDGAKFYSSIKLFKLKIYNDNVLVRDFIPCYRNSDNEVGLYDIVNGVFYTNQGTGTFTYGSIAPTPDAPINIDVVTGEQTIKVNGKNLLKGIEEGNISDITGEDVTSTEYWRSKDFVKIPKNESLYFSLNNQSSLIEKSLRLYNKNKQYIGYTSNAGTYPFYTSNTPVTKVTSVIDDTPAYLRFVTAKSSFESENDNVMLNIATFIGSQPYIDTTYEPYQEQNFNINLHGKNLIPTDASDWEQGTISSTDGTNSSSTKRIRTKEYYPINNDTNYYISTNETNGKFLNIHFYDVNYKYLGNYYSIDGSISGATNKLINVSSASLPNIAYMRPVLISKTSNVDISPSDIVDIKPMIELGSTKTDFVEYYNYDLRKIDTYEDEIYKDNGKWYKKAYIGKVVLDGSEEDWSTSYRTYTLNNYINARTLSSVASEQGAISNYFKWGNGSSSTYIYGSFWYASGKNLRFQKDETLNLSNFKTWLSTNNVTVYYILATPTTTEITQTELINQLEAISVFTGTNNFTISNLNNVLPSLNVKRLKELDKLS